MPDGQIIAGTNPSGQSARVGLAPKEESAMGHALANQRLVAQNAALQMSFENQRSRTADLRSILCSMDLATLCVCPALELRQFTAAAGHLLGIGPDNIGSTLSLSEAFGLVGSLMARMQAVLAAGIAESKVVEVAPHRFPLCRLLPLYEFKAVGPAIDGVIITFTATSSAAADLPATSQTIGSPVADTRHDNSGLLPGHISPAMGLTPRQQQVLCQVLAGHPSKNIAADLGISRRTVENHRAAIMARTGATSLPALARLAVGADVAGDCIPAHSRGVCG